MAQIKEDPLNVTTRNLRDCLEAPTNHPSWTEELQRVLAEVAAAVQETVKTTEKTKRDIGEVNPNLQHTPSIERHAQEKRRRLINLQESIRQFRADISQVGDSRQLNLASLKNQGLELVEWIEKLQHSEDAFLLETINSNPGAGE